MAGATIVFSIPVGLAMLDKRDHKYMALGIMSGILTVPVGVFITSVLLTVTSTPVRDTISTTAASTHVFGAGLGTVLTNLSPLLVTVVLIALGLWFVPDFMIRAFMVFGRVMDTGIKLVLAFSIVEYFTGGFSTLFGAWGFDPIIADEVDQFRALEIAGYIGILLAGAFPMVYAVRVYLAKPLGAFGRKVGISTEGSAGLLATMANIIAMYHLVKTMPARDKVINIAFAVCAAFLFGDHLAFTANFQPNLAVPLIREDQIVGALVVRRKAPGPFSPELAELLQTFATQSVLAIQNARLFREIQEKSAALEQASQHKSQFLANMSHELRTPLNAIIGVSEILLEDAHDLADRADQIEPLERVLRAGRHLLALINDVLDLSKIEAGRMLIEQVSFDLASLLDSLGRVYGTLADARGLAYTQTIHSALPRRALGDPVRLRQILTNYLNNALKFTRDGRITLDASAPRSGWLRVEVSDTGPGIDGEVQSRLFTPFTQADQSTTRRFGGLGLGLAIVNDLMRLHGGDVDVRSPGIGHGATFAVTFRASDAPAVAADPSRPAVKAISLKGYRVMLLEDHASRLDDIGKAHQLMYDNEHPPGNLAVVEQACPGGG